MQTQRRIRTAEGVQRQARELRKEMTGAETLLWERLRDRQLGGWKFRRQAPLGPFVADFYCPACRLVIELDGEIHAFQAEQDQTRTAYLKDLGCRVIRFTNSEVEQQIEAVLDQIAAACAARNGY